MTLQLWEWFMYRECESMPLDALKENCGGCEACKAGSALAEALENFCK